MADTQPNQEPKQSSEIDQVVAEVVGEAHLRAEALKPEEREYLKEHALKKSMRVLHIWALGVGVVITGEYFGWNPGLKEGGPNRLLDIHRFLKGCSPQLGYSPAIDNLTANSLRKTA